MSLLKVSLYSLIFIQRSDFTIIIQLISPPVNDSNVQFMEKSKGNGMGALYMALPFTRGQAFIVSVLDAILSLVRVTTCVVCDISCLLVCVIISSLESLGGNSCEWNSVFRLNFFLLSCCLLVSLLRLLFSFLILRSCQKFSWRFYCKISPLKPLFYHDHCSYRRLSLGL